MKLTKADIDEGDGMRMRDIVRRNGVWATEAALSRLRRIYDETKAEINPGVVVRTPGSMGDECAEVVSTAIAHGDAEKDTTRIHALEVLARARARSRQP